MENNKKNKLLLILGILLALIVIGYVVFSMTAGNFFNNGSKLVLIEGDTYLLGHGTSYSSSDETIVSVNEKGELLAHKSGSAIITYLKNGKKIKYYVSVKTDDESVKVVGVSFYKEILELEVGDEEVLEYHLTPDNATNKSVSWFSSNENVATVEEGKVKALSQGEAEVSIMAGNNTTANIKVKVKEKKEDKPITLDKQEIYMYNGVSTSVVADSNNNDLSWSSSDNNIVSVNNGVISSTGVGDATVIVETDDGQKTEVIIHVIDENQNEVEKVSRLYFDNERLDIEVGTSYNLSLKYEPNNAVLDTITWFSSNSNVVNVNQYGVITARSIGTSTITAKNANGISASINITVKEKYINVSAVSLNKSEINLNEGETEKLVVSINPVNASNKNIIWKSSNEQIASVSEDGLVVAKKKGSAVISVITSNNLTASTKVNVSSITVDPPVNNDIPVSSISLNKTSEVLRIGETSTLIATINPSNATNKTLKWSSSNNNVATVNNGVVQAINSGNATIIVSSSNGKTASYQLTVQGIRVESVSLNKSSVEGLVYDKEQLTASVYPSNATNKGITWTTSDPNIVKVSSTGQIELVGRGTATITARSVDGGKEATCTVVAKNSILVIGNSKTYRTGSSKEHHRPSLQFTTLGYTTGHMERGKNAFTSLGTLTYDGKTGYMANNTETTILTINSTSLLVKSQVNKIKEQLTNRRYNIIILQDSTNITADDYNTFKEGAVQIILLASTKGFNGKVYIRSCYPLNDSNFNSNVTKMNNNTNKLANELGGIVINEANAYKKAKQKGITIFDTDNHHQSNDGAYLSALCMFTKVFNANPVTEVTTDIYATNKTVAKQLRQIAYEECS